MIEILHRIVSFPIRIVRFLKRRVFRIAKLLRKKLFTRHHIYDARELFFQQNKASGFNRYDMIVRLLAVEDYFGKNNYGFRLYKKMQAARISPEWVEPSVERFKALIESYEKNGYDEQSEIIIDQNLNLLDGSHRMALAMYYKHYEISCKVRPWVENISYGVESFIEYDFSDNEIKLIQNRCELLKKEISVPFACTLWAPVREYYDEITSKLGMVGSVLDYKDFSFSDFNYAMMARKIYAVDDIEKWKIEMKIDKMKPFAEKTMRLVLLQIDEPNFRYKKTNKNTLSVKCEQIKKMIRNNYKKKVPGYFHDIVMHIGDNFYQNAFIKKLFDYALVPVYETIRKLTNNHYAITKCEVPYVPSDFPHSYPIGKDADIICYKEEFEQIVEKIQISLNKTTMPYSIRLVQKGPDRTLIRVENDNILIWQFDVSCEGQELTRLAIENRIQANEYYVLSSTYEIIYRIQALYEKPTKVHHLDYINNHRNDIDDELCNRFLNFNWKKIIGESHEST